MRSFAHHLRLAPCAEVRRRHGKPQIVSVAVIFLLRMKDTYECGFEDGLHSSLTKIAKMRYNKDLDVCICVIPADEYKKEVDQCRL